MKSRRTAITLGSVTKTAFDALWDDWMIALLRTSGEPRFYYEGMILHG